MQIFQFFFFVVFFIIPVSVIAKTVDWKALYGENLADTPEKTRNSIEIHTGRAWSGFTLSEKLDLLTRLENERLAKIQAKKKLAKEQKDHERKLAAAKKIEADKEKNYLKAETVRKRLEKKAILDRDRKIQASERTQHKTLINLRKYQQSR